MGTKTIGLRDDVYDRLNARKRDDESFSDLVDRLIDESTPEWRDEFGTLDDDDAAELERIAEASRTQTGAGLSARQSAALSELAEVTSDDGKTP